MPRHASKVGEGDDVRWDVNWRLSPVARVKDDSSAALWRARQVDQCGDSKLLQQRVSSADEAPQDGQCTHLHEDLAQRRPVAEL